MKDKDRKKKRLRFRNLLLYKFNEFFSKGPAVQFMMLLLFVGIIVVILGIVLGITIDGMTTGDGIWQSLMHVLDQGTLGGDDTANKLYIAFMFLATLIGLILMGTIIGIIDNAIDTHMERLKSGQTKVIEKGHLLIIGFDENVHSIIYEQTKSNENWIGNRSIVVLDNKDPDEMRNAVEEKIRPASSKNEAESGIHSLKVKKLKSKLIFRRGSVVSQSNLEMVSADMAKAIIINEENDFETIRIVLALVKYLKASGVYMKENMPNIVTIMHNEENLNAALVAAGVYRGDDRNNPEKIIYDGEEVSEHIIEKVQILYFEDILAHVFGQVCRQPGLSMVMSEIFDYDNADIYIEDSSNGVSLEKMGLVGKSFEDIRRALAWSLPVGIQKESGEICLNPEPDMVLQKNDKIIHLSMDDNQMAVIDKEEEVFGAVGKHCEKSHEKYHILIFGWNEPLPGIIENIAEFITEESVIHIVADKRNIKKDLIKYHKNIVLNYHEINPYDWNQVKRFLNEQLSTGLVTNIMLLCQDDIDRVEADRRTSVLLLNIRAYIDHYFKDIFINITSELNLPEDEALLQDADINDFVVGTELANRIMVQVANEPSLYKVFYELLNDEGSEIYLRYMEDYVDVSKPFSWAFVEEQAANKWDGKHEVAIGWIKYDEDTRRGRLRLNPKGEIDRQTTFDANEFKQKDRLIVIALD